MDFFRILAANAIRLNVLGNKKCQRERATRQNEKRKGKYQIKFIWMEKKLKNKIGHYFAINKWQPQ